MTKYSGRLGLGQPFGDLLGSLQERCRDYQERLTQLIEDLGAVCWLRLMFLIWN